MVFAIHQYESAIGIHSSPLSHIPTPTSFPALTPTPTPSPATNLPGCHRALALGALHHSSLTHWLSILHMVMYYASMLFSQIIPPSPSPESKSLFFTSVSLLLPCT